MKNNEFKLYSAKSQFDFCDLSIYWSWLILKYLELRAIEN